MMERWTKRTDDGVLLSEEHEEKYTFIELIDILLNRLAYYEDMEEQGRLVVLPCSAGAELVRDEKTFKADHWNHTLTAFRENPATRSGRQVALFSIENAEQALKGGADHE